MKALAKKNELHFAGKVDTDSKKGEFDALHEGVHLWQQQKGQVNQTGERKGMALNDSPNWKTKPMDSPAKPKHSTRTPQPVELRTLDPWAAVLTSPNFRTIQPTSTRLLSK